MTINRVVDSEDLIVNSVGIRNAGIGPNTNTLDYDTGFKTEEKRDVCN